MADRRSFSRAAGKYMWPRSPSQANTSASENMWSGSLLTSTLMLPVNNDVKLVVVRCSSINFFFWTNSRLKFRAVVSLTSRISNVRSCARQGPTATNPTSAINGSRKRDTRPRLPGRDKDGEDVGTVRNDERLALCNLQANDTRTNQFRKATR